MSDLWIGFPGLESDGSQKSSIRLPVCTDTRFYESKIHLICRACLSTWVQHVRFCHCQVNHHHPLLLRSSFTYVTPRVLVTTFNLPYMTHNRRSIDVLRDRRFVLRDETIGFTNAVFVSAQDVGSVSLEYLSPHVTRQNLSV